MKKFKFFILFIIFGSTGYGQSISQIAVKKLYSKTICDFFSEMVSYKNTDPDTTNKIEFTLLNDLLPDNLPLVYKNFKIKLVNNQHEVIKQMEKAPGKTGAFYIISHQFKKDTLDVSISRWTVKIKRCFHIKEGRLITRHIFISASCGGTAGYIPTGRSVFDYVSNKWTYHSVQQLITEKNTYN